MPCVQGAARFHEGWVFEGWVVLASDVRRVSPKLSFLYAMVGRLLPSLLAVDKAIGRKLIRKTVLHGLLLVGCALAQVLFLQRLVEKRIVRSSKV